MNLFKMAAIFARRISIAVISAVNKMLQARAAGSVFRAAGAVIFTAMAIGLFPAAGEMMVMNADDDQAVGAADAHEGVSLDIIYRDNPGSEWSLDAARELAGELYDRYGYAARLIPAADAMAVISADAGTDRERDGGAIVIGHTELSETDYTDAYYSVGADGFRTYFNSRGDLIIEAFGSEGAAAGIDRFLSNYNGDSASAVAVNKDGINSPDLNAVLSGYSNFRIDVAKESEGGITISKNQLGDKREVRTLVLAAPDADEHSLAAIEALLDEAEPDLVIFTGKLSAGAGDRAELRAAWAAIAAPLNARGISWSFIGAAEDAADGEELPAVMQNEVVAATEGCIGLGDGSLIEISMGELAGGIWLVGGSEMKGNSGRTSEVCAEQIEAAGNAPVPLCVVTCGDFGECETAEEDDGERLAIDEAELIGGRSGIERMLRAGVSLVVDCDGTGNIDITGGDIAIASAGSIGYRSPGLGGRFAYHNSLRGGVLVTFSHDAEEISIISEYLKVAEILGE